MRALIVVEGGTLEAAEVAPPSPAPSEAIVAVHASSINRGEVNRLAVSEPGTVPGWDLSGVVVEPAPDGSGPVGGARVAGLATGGAWAEQAAVPAARLVELPSGLAHEVAATLPMAGLTAAGILAVAGELRDRRVLVTGASGGVGRLAVQLAVLGGASVTAQVSTAKRGEALDGFGADVVSVGFPEGEFDVILDAVGGQSLGAAIGAVAPGGVVVAYGNSSGEATSFDVPSFYGRAPGSRILAFTIFDALDRGLVSAATLAELLAAASGELDARAALVVALEEVPAVLGRFRAREIAGKVAVAIAT